MTGMATGMATGMLTVPVRHRDQLIGHMVAEPTALPGVVITPTFHVSDARYTGGWSLTHAASGLSLGLGDNPLVYTREAVTLLPDGVDWTADRAELVTVPGLATRLYDLNQEIRAARRAGRPLWWARASWQVEPPQYLTDIGGWSTWSELLADVDQRPVSDSTQYLIDHDFVVERDEPAWSLWCAAPGCCTESVEDPDGWGPCKGERSELARSARGDGWTRHDPRHWLCADCTATHPVCSWFH